MTPYLATVSAANLPDERAKRVSVLNVSQRSIVIRGPKAHVMRMHNPNQKIHYCTFENGGRTNKMLPLSETNIRGRYRDHLHGCRNAAGNMAETIGCVFWGPNWSVVHHNSDARIEDNIVIDGSIVAEAGNEKGIWRNNYVVGTRGITDGTTIDARGGNDDYGITGDAYWMQGGLIEFVDNEAYCYDGTYLNFAPFPMKDGLGGVVKANLNGQLVPTRNVGVKVTGGLALGGRKSGLEMWQAGPDNKEPWRPIEISNVSIHNVWMPQTGLVLAHYSSRMTLSNFNVSGKPGQVGFERNYATSSVTIDTWQCRGLGTDVMAPAVGVNSISNIDTDNTSRCVTIPHDPHGLTPGRKLALTNIGGPIVAEDPTSDATGVIVPASILGEQSTAARHVPHFYRAGADLSGVKEQDLWMVFGKRFYDGITEDGDSFYIHKWQSPSHRFVHPNPMLGGKDNGELDDEFGLWIFGDSGKPFLFFDGPRHVTRPDYAYHFRRDDNKDDRTKGTIVHSGTKVLQPGLNVVTATIGEHLYGEVVFFRPPALDLELM